MQGTYALPKGWMRLCCPCHFGLESVVKFELVRLGAADISAEDGRVRFSGDWQMLAAANIELTAAERVLIELGQFPVGAQSGKTAFDPLFEGVSALPLGQFIGPEDAFPVKGSSLNSALHSVPACQAIVKKAAVKALQRHHRVTALPETGAVHQIQFAIRSDVCTVYLDTSGAPLYKRGWRIQANAAPIRETLAAGILDLSHIRAGSVLCDPFCGSGTFLIEAACRALHIAPGLHRRFAAEQWTQCPKRAWFDAREAARAKINRDAPFHAFGYDIDPAAVTLTAENAKRAGVADRITAVQREISKFVPESGQSIVCNPPYGERMLDIRAAQEIYRTMGQVIPPELPCSIITPDADFERCFGRPARKRRKLYNGMIQCRLYQYWK